MSVTYAKVRELFPENWDVTEGHEGIMVTRVEWLYSDDLPGLALLMQAAARLAIEPSQIRDETRYAEGTYWSTLTGKDSDSIQYRVMFLFNPPTTE